MLKAIHCYWPTNPTWRKFAAVIADGVTLALKEGHFVTSTTDRFSPTKQCMCPMGAAMIMILDKASEETFPTIDTWVGQNRQDECDLALHFQEAFDNEPVPEATRNANGRAARRLGLWYRKTFEGP